MNNKSLFIVSLLFGAAALFFVSGALYFGFSGSPSYEQPLIAPRSIQHPTHSFAAKNPLDSSRFAFMELEYAPPKLRVPNLASVLSYYGVNLRPDAVGDKTLYFSIGTAKELIKVKPHENVYLTVSEGLYSQSENNRPTDLWFTATPQGGKAVLAVKVKNEKGEISDEPKSASQLVLAEKPLSPQQGSWNVGSFKADSALLIRQGAKWYGRDLFLTDLGGQEYAKESGKQRIQFGEGSERYSLYLESGHYAVYREGRWIVPEKGMETASLPLLQLVKVEDKVLGLALYAPGGGQKHLLNMVRSADPSPGNAVLKDFIFIGARTKTHFLFKIGGNREIVAVGDWLLLTPEGWQKIKKVKQVDQFVSGELSGPLMVVQEVLGAADNRYLHGMIYSVGRSESSGFDLSLHAQVRNEGPLKEDEPKEEPAAPSEEEN